MTLRQKIEHQLRALARAMTYPAKRRREDPDGGAQAAGVPAPLKPTPPVLAAAVRLPRSEPGDGLAA